MKQLSTILIALLLSNTILAQDTDAFFSKADAFFNTYVKEGKVAYKKIKDDPATLNALLEMAKTLNVSKQNPAVYQSFWINGYNLLVIKGVVDNYPLQSPLEVAGFFDKTKYTIGSENVTLNEIEHQLLRKNFPEEARFHFVLVCAGLGCPPIIGQAYLPNTLNGQLEVQTKKAINDPNFIRVSKNKAKISQIFEWYGSDFTQGGHSLADYINKYKKTPLPEKVKISFYPYDWTLNELK